MNAALARAALRLLYSPSQPRVPAGSPDGGQWADVGPQGEYDRTATTESGWPASPRRAAIEAKFGALKMKRGVSIGDDKPLTIEAAERVYDVLVEMRGKGYRLPDGVSIVRTEGDDARINGETEPIPYDNSVQLKIRVPDTVPNDANLDEVTRLIFGEQVRSERGDLGLPGKGTVPRFVERSFRDLVIHEMGHVQHAQKGGALPNEAYQDYVQDLARNHVPETEIRARVSGYAAEGRVGEFVAETFVKMYRGETVDAEVMKLYLDARGPRVPPKGRRR